MAEADNVGLGHKIEMSSPNLSMNFRGFLLKAKLHFDQSILIVSWPSWQGGNVSIHPLVTCKQSKTFKEQNMAGWDGNMKSAYLWLELRHELEHESLSVFLMLGVGQVQVGAEVLVQPGGEVMPRL